MRTITVGLLVATIALSGCKSPESPPSHAPGATTASVANQELGVTTNKVHRIGLRHPHNTGQWVLTNHTDRTNSPYRLHVNKEQVVQWRSEGAGRSDFAIVVLDTNQWRNPSPWLPVPILSGCQSCGAAVSSNFGLRLTFMPTNTATHYQIVVPAGAIRRRDRTTEDYDLVDATIVYDNTQINWPGK